MQKYVAIGTFIFALAQLAGCGVQPLTANSEQQIDDWLTASLPDIANGLAKGEISSVDLVLGYLLRIEELDRAGPTLQSVLAINPLALERARELDALRAAGRIAGPLHGVPILLKDNIEARGPLPTTAGSTALASNVTDRDSPLVAGLRNAGAIILGKANLSEWANFRSSASLSGWSALGGQVRNPHILDRNPCGSSSGSGVAVAASLTAGAVGTETNGSIICPSTVNGVVGFKPTVGLVSTEHIVPISSTQDTAGPMTRSVRGAALMLDAMATRSGGKSFSGLLDDASLQDVRIGVLRYAVGNHPGIKSRFEQALRELENAGAVLVDIEQAPSQPDNLRALGRLILDVEFKHTLNSYLANSPANIPVRNLEELIAYDNAHAAEEMPLFGQDIFEQALATEGVNDPEYLAALGTVLKATRDEGIDALLGTYKVQTLVFPSGPLASPVDAINGDVWPAWVGDGSTAAVAGYPHLSVPMGAVNGLPIGLSFVASEGQDAKVLALGYAYEQATQSRVAPAFLPTAASQQNLKRALQRSPLRN